MPSWPHQWVWDVGLDTDTAELTVKTLSSHLITRKTNSPTKSLRTAFVSVSSPSDLLLERPSDLPMCDWFTLREYPSSPRVICLHCGNIITGGFGLLVDVHQELGLLALEHLVHDLQDERVVLHKGLAVRVLEAERDEGKVRPPPDCPLSSLAPSR
eukprot:1139985-Pyramimonas_sp.AAC.2